VLGEGAKTLTASVLSELKNSWTAQFNEWNQRDLSEVTFTYLFADGIYQEIRGDNPKICVLVLMGVDDQGKKHLIALEDGVRESTQSWREVLLGAKARGLNAAKLATGDGALGFWAALSEVFPSTTHQRCWMHYVDNPIMWSWRRMPPILPRQLSCVAKCSSHNPEVAVRLKIPLLGQFTRGGSYGWRFITGQDHWSARSLRRRVSGGAREPRV
jgi:hypothetical protein